MAKKYNIKNSKERDLFRMLGNVGVIDMDSANKHFGKENISSLCERNYLKTEKHYGDKVFILSDKGREYTKKYLVNKLYKRNSKQIDHDLKLADKYLEIYSYNKKEAYSWMNETRIRDYFKDQGKDVSNIDAAYFSKGKLIAVEAISKSYSNQTISEKVEIMEEHFDGHCLL